LKKGRAAQSNSSRFQTEARYIMIQNGSRYVIAYLLWFVSVALAITVLLAWRSSAMIVLGVTQWDRYLEHALNQFGFLFLGIFGLTVIVFTEHYYRTGVEKAQLYVRFFWVTFIELAVLTVAHLVRLFGGMLLELPLMATLPFVAGELGFCILAFLLYRRAARAYVPPLL
jgi:hypothetical protein